jgi:hypothetical protein
MDVVGDYAVKTVEYSLNDHVIMRTELVDRDHNGDYELSDSYFYSIDDSKVAVVELHSNQSASWMVSQEGRGVQFFFDANAVVQNVTVDNLNFSRVTKSPLTFKPDAYSPTIVDANVPPEYAEAFYRLLGSRILSFDESGIAYQLSANGEAFYTIRDSGMARALFKMLAMKSSSAGIAYGLLYFRNFAPEQYDEIARHVDLDRVVVLQFGSVSDVASVRELVTRIQDGLLSAEARLSGPNTSPLADPNDKP